MNTSGMGYRILDERYALLECLAVSGIGEIYRGRDLELAQTENTPSRILIHLLPSQYKLTTLVASTQQAQALTAALNKAWLLPILAQGETGDRQYFVLQSPDGLGAHSLMSLPSQQLPNLNKLMQQFGNLVKHQQLPETLDSAFLISLPNQKLYLLATALIEPLQGLRAHHTGLNIYKRPTLKRAFALSSIMVIAVSTFAVEYRNHSSSYVPIKSTSAALSTPQLLLNDTEATTHDRPTQTELLTLPLALQEPLPKIEPILVKLNAADSTTKQPTKLTERNNNPKATTPLELVEMTDTNSAKITVTPKSPDKKPEEKPKALTKTKETATAKSSIIASQAPVNPPPVAQANNSEAVYYTANVTTTPAVAQPKKTLTPSPELSINDLIERANHALDLQNFSTKNGVLFYARQIKIRDHLHPQVERLGRFVVMNQHEVVRNMLKANELTPAHQLLVNSKNLIQEFNLKSLNSAQQVLEHKSNQYK